ncbi:TetR family transcriptional regulator [bacterium]|nr:TetR family transcriptional regulator [bacterium]
MARRTKEEANATRENILDAALIVFSEKGYSHTTFVDIAKHVGMTKGAVYWHFPTKNDLLAQLLMRGFVQIEELVNESIPGETTLDNLAAEYAEHARVIIENEQFKKLIFFVSLRIEWTEEWIADFDKKIKELEPWPIEKIGRVLAKAKTQGQIKDNVDIHLIEDILNAMFRGLINYHLGGHATTSLPECVKEGFQTVIESIKVE